MVTELQGVHSSRSQRSLDTSAHIKQEGLAFLAELGVDLMSTKDLAALAGISTGPIYARYDTIEDLVLDLWCEVLHPEFLRLLAIIRPAMAGAADERRELAELLADPTLKSQAIVEVLSVARRYPQLSERVGIDLARAFSDHINAQPETAPAMAMAQCTTTFGSMFLSPMVPRESIADWEGMINLVGRASHDPTALAEPHREVEPTIIELPKMATGDVVVDEFVVAAMTVIARVGFEQATSTRIARVAGRGFSTIYNHYSSKEELMVATVESMIQQNIEISFRGFAGLDRETYIQASVANAYGLVSDINRENRQLRIEVLMSARHHKEIAAFAEQGYGEMFSALREAVTQMVGPERAVEILPRTTPLWLTLRSNNIGMALLANISPIMRDVDWTPASAALYGLIGHIMNPS